ncbi:hypothetical protein ACFRR7_23900 [Streptomyces sp. NPDC056909]|uniref:hypothetical protein n=1 Tax=Streptomyces sp. NPDC056909 TaxID=3345963 RepID=UPI0036890D31
MTRRLPLRLIRLLLWERLPLGLPRDLSVPLSLEALSLFLEALPVPLPVPLFLGLRERLPLRQSLRQRQRLRELAAVRIALLRSVRLSARLSPVRLLPAVRDFAVPGLLLGAVLRPPGLSPRLPARRALRGRVRGLAGDPGRAAVTGQHNAFVRGPSGRVLRLIPLSAVRHRDSYMWNVWAYRTSVHATG